ncbi:hypothetical protein [Gordonia polyisoprenivorans]|uniref:hypothetical protein n=1 Tax=Gordonia polyisoprenivorans TaxID=84595 RepID=UPI00230185F6|nr:hypothetical protein [Gordonia polyisoprenivorans]WCB35356.1 hypothetical protein PHA63_14590 [Gordonia polyisoprenivorans]
MTDTTVRKQRAGVAPHHLMAPNILDPLMSECDRNEVNLRGLIGGKEAQYDLLRDNALGLAEQHDTAVLHDLTELTEVLGDRVRTYCWVCSTRAGSFVNR